MSILQREIAKEIKSENFEVTQEGIILPRLSVGIKGEYFDRVNGGEWQRTPNLITDEGMAHILNVALGSTAKPSDYFIALFSGSATPQANWTAASFAGAAGEVTSGSEGYTSATRPKWQPTDATTNAIDNMNNVASLTIITASQLTVTGAALLTNSTKGGTTGKLVSATKYAASRTFQNGDVYQVGYRISLTV